MREHAGETRRRSFLRLAGVAAGVGCGLPAATGSAAAQTTAWERLYRHEDEASVVDDIVRTRDGGYAFVGSTFPVLDEANTWLVKLDAGGDVEWSRAYDDDPDDPYDDDFGAAVVELPDGYLVASRDGDSGDVRVFRTDSDGDVVASRRFGRTETSVDVAVDAVAVSGDGGDAPDGYAVLASSFEGGDGDAWLLRLDADLSVRWERSYGGEGSLEPAGLARPADGGYAVAATATADGGGGFRLGRTDDCGDPCWSRTYDGADGSTTAAAVAERRRGGRTAGYALVGTARSASGWALRAVTTGPDGSARAARTFDFGRYSVGADVVATEAGYALLATASPRERDLDLLLAVVDGRLGVARSEYYGRSRSYDYVEEAAALTRADGEYGLAGAYLSGGDFDTARGYVVSVEDA